jgi:hypothetical protein
MQANQVQLLLCNDKVQSESEHVVAATVGGRYESHASVGGDVADMFQRSAQVPDNLVFARYGDLRVHQPPP